MIVVFLGPTLARKEAETILEAEFRGPAAQGDVYRAVRRGASAIGLIDGFFHSVPSVWHKELLWAMSEGVPVYGSGSMGALRAAELHAFGMVGVGEVFEAFRDGVLTDDDEVALAHAESEHDYRPLSEPMVDIRATVELARSRGVIDAAQAQALLAAAKRLFYPDRVYPTIIADAGTGITGSRLEAFAQWWPNNRVSAKRRDAVAMLRRMKADLADRGKCFTPSFWFERTALWEDLVRSAEHWDGRDATDQGETLRRAMRCNPELDSESLDIAMARVLALDEARRQQFQLDEEALYEAVIEFRRRRGLVEPEDVERWMAENELDGTGFLRISADEARLDWVRRVLRPEVIAMLADHLRATGRFDQLKQSG